MSTAAWTITQQRRLKELGGNPDDSPPSFADDSERNKLFQRIEKKLVQKQQEKLTAFLQQGGRVGLDCISISCNSLAPISFSAQLLA